MNKIRNIFIFILFGITQHSFSQSQISLLSWNIRDFGKTKTEKTISEIATILRDYDIVAIQEVVAGYGGAQAVARLADELNRKGAKWDYVISNPTKSPPYKTERYAFLWKTKRIKAIGRGKLLSKMEKDIFREPFIMDFKINNKIVHIYNYHSRKHRDNPEIEVIKLVNYIASLNGNNILAGDFNLNEKHIVFENLYKREFKAVIHNSPTTLKIKCKNIIYLNHSIDNIFYNFKKIKLLSSGKIDFVKECYNLVNARYISDHLPVFMIGIILE